MREDLNLHAREAVDLGSRSLVSDDVQLVEAVVPSSSAYLGQTLVDSDFRAKTGINVLAISKHGDIRPTKIGETPLEVGDALLIQGHARDLRRLQTSRALLVLGELSTRPFGRRAWVTVGLLLSILMLAIVTPVHLAVLALAGAVGLVLMKCVKPNEIRQATDWSVLILLGGMLSLGTAFTKHGLDAEVANWITGMGTVMDNPYVLLAIVLGISVILTQLIEHVASAVIMTPVALAIATQIGASDRPFVMAVLAGAGFAFMSPVAHQANAMVMGPGDYRYRDFLRAGTPLALLFSALSVVLIPIFFPF